MDAQADASATKRKLSLNNATALNESVSPQSDEASKYRSASPSPNHDDFLTIVPKPTLLSKEKAKRRLQAFGLSRFSSYLNTKKQKLAAETTKNDNAAEAKSVATVEDADDAQQQHAGGVEDGGAMKKSPKKARHIDAARETVEAIEKCKLEETNFLQIVQNESEKLSKMNYMERKRRRRSSSRERAKRVETAVRTRSRSVEKRTPRERKSPARTEKRSSFSRDRFSHERRASYGRDREKKSWSDYEDEFAENPHSNEVNAGLVDIRRMLLFHSVCYNFRPYQYKKVDGSLTTISAQYVRFTVKASPRIVYCPNPSNIKGTYFQRKETFSIIPKPQKECLMNLISQAERAKPITPHKPATTRNWYSHTYLLEQHTDDGVDSEASEDGKEPKSSKRDKSKKSKSRSKDDKEERSKRHRSDKQKRKESRRDKKGGGGGASSTERSRESTLDDRSAGGGRKERKRTDSQKSDNNSNNSTIGDKSHNHASSLSSSSPASRFHHDSNAVERPTHKSEQLLPPPDQNKKVGDSQITPPTSFTTTSDSSYKSKSKSKPVHEHGNKHKDTTSSVKQDKLDFELTAIRDKKREKDEAAEKRYNIQQNCRMAISPRVQRLSELDHKSYSKKALISLALPPGTPLSATKIYNIETDSVDSKAKQLPTISIISNDNIAAMQSCMHEQQQQPDGRKAEVKLEHLTEEPNQSGHRETIDNKNKILLEHFDPIAEIGEKRPLKEVPIEKLKTKPSELYSPTLQSLTSSDSSHSSGDMPDTNEYRSHWESEEEYSAIQPSVAKAMNNSWESEDEEYPAAVVVERVIEKKPKELTERSLEMPLNINFSRPRSQLILPKATPQIKPLLLFEDLDGTSNSWDADMKQTSSFEVKPDVDTYSKHYYDTLPMIDKPNLEDEYMQFMSSVSSIEESNQRKRRYSTSSSSTSSSSSSSSSESSSSSNEDNDKQADGMTLVANDSINNDRVDAIHTVVAAENSPICKVDSTSSPAIITQDENKLDLSSRKTLTTIVLAKKNPLVGCSLFKDEDSDNEDAHLSVGTEAPNHQPKVTSEMPMPETPTKPVNDVLPLLPPEMRKQSSPIRKRSDGSPKRTTSARGSSPTAKRYPSIKRYSPKRDRRRSPRRRESSPRRKDASPRCASTPRNKDSRDGSPKRDSPRHRDISPKRRDADRKSSPRHYGRDISPRRRSPKHKDSSRDGSPRHDLRHRSPPKHRDRSPRSNIDLPRHRDYDRDRHRDGDIARNRDDRYRDRKYRDGSPLRYRESPNRYSPSRRRTPPRHRYSPKRDRSPRYRDRSPRRRSNSPPRRVYSRSRSKERKHESITQALHRLAGMEYEPPKSPPAVNSPMDGYIRGVADSTISDEQLMQNRSIGGGGDFNSTQSPVYFTQPYKLNNDGTSSSPKRIPLDDRINQVLGIDAPKPINSTYQTDQGQYYNQMYYDQYLNMPNHDYDHGNYKHYNRHLIDVNSVSSNKVLQVGNVLQVVPTEQQVVVTNKKKDEIIDPTLIQIDSCQKFVPVGNMLQIVPTTELPTDNTAKIVADLNAENKKKADDLLQIKMSERKAERDKRRLERERRRKEKELKRKEREKRKQLKIKMKSEEMIKKALMLDVTDDVEDDYKLPTVSIVSNTTKISKGILVVHDKNQKREDVQVHKQKKGVKFADGVLPGEGTSPSAGEELSSPPPFSKMPKEKRYTKTKKPKKTKQMKKKIKVKIIRKSKKKDDDDVEDGNLPPPSPPPGSPPPHIFPPRVKPMYPNYYPNYQFNAVNCRPMTEAPHHPFPNLPNMQYPIQPHLIPTHPVPLQPHLAPSHLGPPHPIPAHLTAPPHLVVPHPTQPPPPIAAMHPVSLQQHLHAPRLPPKSHTKSVDKGL